MGNSPQFSSNLPLHLSSAMKAVILLVCLTLVQISWGEADHEVSSSDGREVFDRYVREGEGQKLKKKKRMKKTRKGKKNNKKGKGKKNNGKGKRDRKNKARRKSKGSGKGRKNGNKKSKMSKPRKNGKGSKKAEKNSKKSQVN